MTKIGNSDLEVAPLNFGGNVFGWAADRQTSFDLLDAFTASGGDFIDTADMYSYWVPGNTGGDSERLIGEWLTSRGKREDVVIATKVGSAPERKGLRSANVVAAVDESLTRLQTDYIDLYYAHYDDPEVPIDEIAGTFSELVDAGKIRQIGISNTEPDRIDGWFEAVGRNGLHAPVALQPHYNLVERDFETNGLLDAAERYNLGVLPYYSLAGGFLTGKYRAGVEVDSVRAPGAVRYLESHPGVPAALDEVAAAHGVTPTSIALAWLATKPTVAAPIVSASRVEQMPALFDSLRVELTAEQIAFLEQA